MPIIHLSSASVPRPWRSAACKIEFRNPARVADGQEYRCPPPIERERQPPDTAIGREAQFLQVGEAARLQRIHRWSAKLRAELSEQPQMRGERLLNLARQRVYFRQQSIMELNLPC